MYHWNWYAAKKNLPDACLGHAKVQNFRGSHFPGHSSVPLQSVSDTQPEVRSPIYKHII